MTEELEASVLATSVSASLMMMVMKMRDYSN